MYRLKKDHKVPQIFNSSLFAVPNHTRTHTSDNTTAMVIWNVQFQLKPQYFHALETQGENLLAVGSNTSIPLVVEKLLWHSISHSTFHMWRDAAGSSDASISWIHFNFNHKCLLIFFKWFIIDLSSALIFLGIWTCMRICISCFKMAVSPLLIKFDTSLILALPTI